MFEFNILTFTFFIYLLYILTYIVLIYSAIKIGPQGQTTWLRLVLLK